MKKLPTNCPSCSKTLAVKQMVCISCATQLEGSFDLPMLARLSPEDQDFVRQFMLASGSLKDLAKLWRLSYPTVRNRLDELISRLRLLEKGAGQ
jgi:hypothetical protein